MTRARTTLEVGNLGAQARQLSALAGIEAGRVSSIGQIAGAGIQARAGINAGANYTLTATGAQVRDSNRQTETRAGQAQRQAQANWSSESLRIAGESSAFKTDNWGNYMSAIPYVGAIPQAETHGFGNTQRTWARNDANNWLFARTYKNEGQSAQDVILSQNMYRNDISQGVETMRAESIKGVNEGVGTAIGAANQGAGIASGGVNKAYQIELKANEVQFGGTRDAATISRDAGFEAAKDRQVGMILTSMSRDIARRLEEAGRQRY
jgi:hypothetical protein